MKNVAGFLYRIGSMFLFLVAVSIFMMQYSHLETIIDKTKDTVQRKDIVREYEE